MRAVAASLRELAAGGAVTADRALNENYIRLAMTGFSRTGAASAAAQALSSA